MSAQAENSALAGEAFEFHGEAISVDVPGQGLVLALRDQNVAVHGMGPLWFWDAKGWTWPMVGDSIIVSGRTVRYGESTYHVALRMVFGGQSLELRDKQSGLPRWHGQGLYIPLQEERP